MYTRKSLAFVGLTFPPLATLPLENRSATTLFAVNYKWNKEVGCVARDSQNITRKFFLKQPKKLVDVRFVDSPNKVGECLISPFATPLSEKYVLAPVVYVY